MNQCWICGAKANSGEHKVKKSDLKQLMSQVSQKSPIYHQVNGEKKRPIGSLKAEALKYEKSICSLCNGSLTQKHDYAWEQLSKYLGSTELSRKATVNLDSVFDSDVDDNIKFVHLYFAKLFGCKVIESGLELDLSGIAMSISNDSTCPQLYLMVRHSDNGKSKGFCSVSDLEVFKDGNGSLIYAHFFITVGEYTVDVLYSDDTEDLEIAGYFQPVRGLASIDIGEVSYLQSYAAQNN